MTVALNADSSSSTASGPGNAHTFPNGADDRTSDENDDEEDKLGLEKVRES